MNALWLCADDYAQNAEISEGIRRLYTLRRINAVSCMTNVPLWCKEGQKLCALHREGYWGLHLNLTHGPALSTLWRSHYGENFHSLAWMMTHRLSPYVIEAECRAQLDAFCGITGQLPDFIDGHQHVHQFPQVADVLLPLMDAYQFKGMVRVSSDIKRTYPLSFKAFIIAWCGADRLRKLLGQREITCNSSFSGVYPFCLASHYAHYFQKFLKRSMDNGLIMCHPGLASDDPQDPLNASRYQEFLYFSGEQFIHDLSQYHVVLKRKRVDK